MKMRVRSALTGCESTVVADMRTELAGLTSSSAEILGYSKALPRRSMNPFAITLTILRRPAPPEAGFAVKLRSPP